VETSFRRTQFFLRITFLLYLLIILFYLILLLLKLFYVVLERLFHVMHFIRHSISVLSFKTVKFHRSKQKFKINLLSSSSMTVFWDVTSCSLMDDCRRLGVTCFLNLLVWRRRQHFLHDVDCYLSTSSSRP